MKILVAALITALLVFAIATTWTDVVQPRLDAAAMASAKKAAESMQTVARRNGRKTVTDEDDVGDEPIRPTNKTAARTTKKSRDENDLANQRLRKQLADFKQQESKLIVAQDALRLIYDDIRSEMATVEAIRRQSAGELAMAERNMLSTAMNSSTSNGASSGPSRTASTNSRRSGAPETSSARTVALFLKDLATNGSEKDAVSFLTGIKDLQKAKVLSSLSELDPKLARRLTLNLQAARKTDSLR